jgi:hypothetical protein
MVLLRRETNNRHRLNNLVFKDSFLDTLAEETVIVDRDGIFG